jgi:hypothetical protein
MEKKEGNLIAMLNHSLITEQPSYLFCDRIEYIYERKQNTFNHHLMFYKKQELIFKIWLPNKKEDRPYSCIGDALSSLDIRLG